MNDRNRHRAGTLALAVIVLMLTAALPGSSAWSQIAAREAQASARSGDTVADVCAEGMVNGLITVSIAAATALVAEIVLPAYPVLAGVGLGVGCSVRSYGLKLWRGSGT